MSDNTGTVRVISPEKQETFAINGVVSCIQDAVNKFYGAEENVPGGISISLNGNDASNLGQALRDRDVILIMPSAVASGGFKGAL